MEKHHLDGQPEEARFYIPEGADNKGVQCRSGCFRLVAFVTFLTRSLRLRSH